MPRLTPQELLELTPELIGEISRADLERTALLLVELALDQASRLNRTSGTSSQPPSKDDPYRRREQRSGNDDEPGPKSGGGGGGMDQASATTVPASVDATGNPEPRPSKSAPVLKPPAKPPGKRPGKPGFWRTQPIVATSSVNHDPEQCERCGAVLGVTQRQRVSEAFYTYELDRNPLALRVTCTMHRYHVARCACGYETAAQPGTGAQSQVEGRKRDLVLTERCLVGPLLATFIAALALRYRLSRTKIQEFLNDWLGFELGRASINRCVHEFGLASEPVVEELLKEVQSAPVAHVDETPWYQAGVLCWLWVVATARKGVIHPNIPSVAMPLAAAA